jgi:putative DNA primase/helicase
LIDLNDAPHPFPPQVRYDLDAIVVRLRATAEDWVPRLFPNGRRVGDEWRLANIKGAPPRKHGSCVIRLRGEHAGDWHDFDGSQGGGPLSAIEEPTGLSGRDLFAYAAELTGWSPSAPNRQEPPASTAAKQEGDTAREIAFILKQAAPLAGTPAETYLASRGLVVPEGADLLAHADLTHWETKSGYPALIGVVRDRAGEVIAIHRTYLQCDAAQPDKVAKAAVSKPRMMLGKVAGGAVRLAPISEGCVLGLCEGMETGLAVMTACPGLPVWAALSATNLEQVQLPPEALRVVILADHDISGAGMRAAETAARRLRAEGRQVAIALPPAPDEDFNDLLLREGTASVAAIVRAALQNRNSDSAAPEATGRHLPIGFVEPATPLPALRADEGDLARAVDHAWNVLLVSNRTPWLFRAAGLPTWIVPDDEGRPVAVSLTDERLRHMLAKLAIWRRIGRNGDLMPAHPPTALIKSLLATPDPDLPVLAGIVSTPVFGRGGTLLTEPGYHPDARLLYHAAPGFTLPSIPEQPTAEQIAEARSLLLDDLLGDFPFTSVAERAHAVAVLLLGFVRAMVDGPTPLHLVEKPTPGTGATLMVDAIATILTGAGASVMTEGRDDEEWRKRVTAKLRQIPPIVLIDNLRQKLDSSAVAAALTAPFWEDRILGASEMVRLPIRCVWIATGNNPEFSNEMARRIVRLRLDAHVERPWQRGGFRHPDLMTWVRANRARLVGACLTLCQAWIVAGRPRGARTIGSYENWAQVLGGVLETSGIEGFLCNLDEMLEASDGEGVVWRSFVSAWWDRFGTAEVGTNDLYETALSCEPPLPLGSGNDRSQRIRLGKALGRLRDRVFHLNSVAVRPEICGTLHGAQRWRLAIDETRGTEKHSQHSPAVNVPVNVVNVGECFKTNIHSEICNEANGVDSVGECCECFSNPYTCARARAPAREGPVKHSQHSQHSPDSRKPQVSNGECAGECHPGHSPIPKSPDWLKEVL